MHRTVSKALELSKGLWPILLLVILSCRSSAPVEESIPKPTQVEEKTETASAIQPTLEKSVIDIWAGLQKDGFLPSTQVLGVFSDGETIYIDISVGPPAGIVSMEMEQKWVQSLLTAIHAKLPTFKRLKILVDHEEVETLFTHVYARQAFRL